MRRMAFALALVLLTAVAAMAAPGDEFDRISIGAVFLPLDGLRAVLPKAKIPSKDGAVVIGVLSNSPAATGRMSVLDLITYAGSRRVHSEAELMRAIQASPAGKDLRLKGYHTTVSENGNTAHFELRTFRVRPERLGDVLLAGVRKKVDGVRGLTFYNDVEAPESTSDGSDSDVYFAMKNGTPEPLRLRLMYVGKHWLFVERFVFKANGQTFTVAPPRSLDVERDVLTGGVSEWYDASPKDLPKIVEAIWNDSRAVLRYEGKTEYLDRQITANERSRLWRMMMVHRMLGGSP
jgi:PDZ domain-containing protein